MGKTKRIEVTLTHKQDVPKGEHCSKRVMFSDGHEGADIDIEPCERLDGEWCTLFWKKLEVEKRKSIKTFEYIKKHPDCIKACNNGISKALDELGDR